MTDVLTPMEVKKALLAGYEEKIADEHKKGKLTSRERIARVLDAGSFMETNVFMKRANAACCSGGDQAGESVVTGYGTAVSYTHLDVYKRQPLWNGRILRG